MSYLNASKVIAVYLLSITIGFESYSQGKYSDKDTFILRGKLLGRDTGTLVLTYIDGGNKQVRDTSKLADGNFIFKGQISQPTYANIRGTKKYVDFYNVNDADLYLEAGQLVLNLTEDDFAHFELSGSRTQKEVDTLKHRYYAIAQKHKPLIDSSNQLKKAYQVESDEIRKEQLRLTSDKLLTQLKVYNHEVRKATLEFIMNHPDSYASVTMLYLGFRTLGLDSSKMFYNNLSKKVKSSRYGLFYAGEIKKKAANMAGTKAPDFEIHDKNNRPVSLSKLSGKHILLNFWASWCLPCRKEIPEIKQLYKRYHEKGFEIIMVSIDNNKKDWKTAIEKDEIGNWFNIIVDDDITANYENTRLPIPSWILIDGKGNILVNSNYDVPGSTLRDHLGKYLE